jgi:signal transduction histidine kinase
MLVLHDLTEIERLNQVRQDFVANVSHELKTPLTSLKGYAETLLEGGLDDVENREGFVRIIRDQSARLQNLVDDLLSLADLERPDVRLRREAFDLREAVERQVTTLRARAAQAQLTLDLEPGEETPVVADRLRIDQVVANLLDNALKYTERGGIRVRAGHSARRRVTRVRALLPGRQGALAREERHRARALDRAPHPGAARRAGDGRERSGSGQHVPLRDPAEPSSRHALRD